MAITTSSQNGIQILSSAANGTLGVQTGAGNNQVIIPSGILTTNNGNIETTIAEPGRLIMIRKGTSTEEIRYCVGATGTTLDVHENWTQPPVSGDTYDISYILQDAATVTGLALIVKRVQDYSSNRRFRVLSGGWMAFLNGVSLETHDKTDAVTPVFSVETGGYFDSGYLASNFPVSGSTLISTADQASDYGVAFDAGSSCRLYDLIVTGVQQNKSTINGDVVTQSVKFFNVLYQADYTGTVSEPVMLNDVILEGKGDVNDTILVNQYTEIDQLALANTNGFLSNDDATTEIITVRDAIVLGNNLRYILVNNDKTWRFVNPVWDVDTTTQNDISFENGTNNSVQELYNFKVGVQSPSGGAIPGSQVYLYEGLTTQSITSNFTTGASLTGGALGANGTGYVVDDVLLVSGGTFTSQASILVTSVDGGGGITGFEVFNPGEYSVIPTGTVALTSGTGTSATFIPTFGTSFANADILTRTFTDNAGTSLNVSESGDYALKVYNYGNNPFVSAISFTEAVTQTVVLAVDQAITEPDPATAITNGAGIVYIKHAAGETDPRPMKVIRYESGTGTVPSVGETLTSGTSTGDVVEYLGTAVDGVVVLENWNGTEFTDNTLITGATFSATTNTTGDAQSFYEEYTYEVDAFSQPMTTVYDYLAARMAETPITTEYEDILIWGEDEQSQLVYAGADGYFTERNSSRGEGVWVSNRGAGDVAYFTSDSGTQYIPPVNVSFTITGLVANSEVRIFRSDNRDEVAGVENSGTTFTYNYTYTGADLNVYFVVFSLNYKEIRQTNITLSNVNQSIPVQQQIDRVYLNP